VAVRLERARDGVRDRSDLAIAARAAHQRAGDADVLMTEDWVKVAAINWRARRRLRSAHHGGALGNALLRSRLADGRRSSGGTEVFVDERFAVPAPH
jgi:hypothetical protein